MTETLISQTTFDTGEYIFKEGDPGDCAYIIESGMVEITLDRKGQETVIATLSKGDILGEVAIIDRLPRSGSARAVVPTELTEIPLKYFSLKIEESDPTVRMFLRIIMSRYRDLNARLGKVLASLPKLDSETDPENFDSTTSELKDVVSQFNDMQKSIDLAVTKPSEADKQPAYSDDTLEMTRTLVTEEVLLANAIKNKEFVLYYQPIIDLDFYKIVGCEALVRWHHPSGELLTPAGFINQLEKTDLIIELGYWIAQEACEFQKRIFDQFRYDFFVAINLSGKQFNDQLLVPNLSRIIEASGARSNRIEFEVTESLLVANPERASDALHELKETGAKLAIDDFGTGYSSFSYLHRFPLDKLKIDRAFVSSMTRVKKSKQIVKSLINLAHDMEMKVVAEGIEHKEEAEMLRDHRADFGQGYFFSKPISEEEIFQMIRPKKI